MKIWQNVGMALLVCLASMTLIRGYEKVWHFIQVDSCLDSGGAVISDEICVNDKEAFLLKCEQEPCYNLPLPEVVQECFRTGGNIGGNGCFREKNSYGITCKGTDCYATQRVQP